MTSNIVLQFTKFDFNKADIAFIERHVQPQYQPSMQKVVKDIRGFFADRAWNKDISVYYDVRSEQEDEVTVRLEETFAITIGGEDVLTVTVTKAHPDKREVYTNQNHYGNIMALADSMMAKGIVFNPEALSVFHTLRPVLCDLSKSVTTFFQNSYEHPGSLQFVTDPTDDSPYVTIVEVDFHTTLL